MNVVITGASRGLGKAIAEQFAMHGHHLCLCSRNEITLYKTTEELLTKYPGIEVRARPADLAGKQAAQTFGQWLLDNKYAVDVLVNNAGSFIPGSVYNEPDGAMEEMMAVNFFSAYHLTRILLPEMMKRRASHIFNICSIASLQAYKNGGAYSISKFALLGFSKNLREELKEYNIKVTAIIPGAAYTDSWISSGIDRKRFMEADDIAAIIYASSQLSVQACVEEIILRPQSGDI